MRWQRRARLAIAIFGIAFAGVVFFAVGERQPPVAAPAPLRLDPKAVVETARGLMNRVTGSRQDFVVNFDRQLSYENGESKLLGVRIEVKERQGRDFVITGDEALANEKSREINLTGGVRLMASDGFELSTAAASFRESDGVVRTPGAVSFKKGAMRGTGVGMTYDKNTDVLTIASQAHVLMVDGEEAASGEFTAGAATLARQENYLQLDGAVHALRGGQTIDADSARANLTEQEEALTSIELRGNARVSGGSAGFESLAARDVDLVYAGDGETIERVRLDGAGAIELKGTDGAAGRRMRGETLDLVLAADGSLTAATGRDGVALDLPAAGTQGAREVRSEQLDARGEAGKGMTSARFTKAVEYVEQAAGGGARTARAAALVVDLDGDAVGTALFSGRVRFEERGLAASAAEARYVPETGVLRLAGADEGGGPRVADEQIAIEAEAIEVTLEGRRMVARGGVKTILQGRADNPGLLQGGQPVNVSAASLTYDGTLGTARYVGGAQLWQGDTAIRGETIALDREGGNLSAAGGARATLALGGESSVARAEEIEYDDAARRITYLGAQPPVAVVSKTPPAAAAAAPAAVPAHLSGPQGDLRAERIVAVLHPAENRLQRLEAYTGVTLRVDQRLATGARLTYHAEDDRYVMSGATGVPVTVVEACRETTGRTLTFFKSTDRIIVDGNEEIRTRTTSGGPCPQPPDR